MNRRQQDDKDVIKARDNLSKKTEERRMNKVGRRILQEADTGKLGDERQEKGQGNMGHRARGRGRSESPELCDDRF